MPSPPMPQPRTRHRTQRPRHRARSRRFAPPQSAPPESTKPAPVQPPPVPAPAKPEAARATKKVKPKPSPSPAPAAPFMPAAAGEPSSGQYWQVVATARPDAEIIAEALGKKGFHVVPGAGAKRRRIPRFGWAAPGCARPGADPDRPGIGGLQESDHAEILRPILRSVNFSLALLSAMLLVLLYPNLIFPGFGLPWLAPVALVPLLHRSGARTTAAVALSAG